MATKAVKTPFGIIYPNRTEKPPAYDAQGNPKRSNIHIHKRSPKVPPGKTTRCVACGEEFDDE